MADRPILFIDRSLGKKKVGERLQAVGASVQLHDTHFPQTTEDEVWIPDVTARGWVILTKDKNIRRPRGEREAVLLASARVFTLTSGNMTGDVMAQTFVDHLAEIERIAGSQSPPFVYVVGPNEIRQIYPPPGSGAAQRVSGDSQPVTEPDKSVPTRTDTDETPDAENGDSLGGGGG